MALRSYVVRGLPKEVQEEIDKFLESRPAARVVHMGQSESGDHISVTLIVEEPDAPA